MNAFNSDNFTTIEPKVLTIGEHPGITCSKNDYLLIHIWAIQHNYIKEGCKKDD